MGESAIPETLPKALADPVLHKKLEEIDCKKRISRWFYDPQMHELGGSPRFESGLPNHNCRQCVRDTRAADGGVVEAADLHRASLAALADRIAAIAADAPTDTAARQLVEYRAHYRCRVVAL